MTTDPASDFSLPAGETPLGIRQPLMPDTPLGQPLLQPKFITPLGARSLSVLDPGVFLAAQRSNELDWQSPFEDSPFFDAPDRPASAEPPSASPEPRRAVPTPTPEIQAFPAQADPSPGSEFPRESRENSNPEAIQPILDGFTESAESFSELDPGDRSQSQPPPTSDIGMTPNAPEMGGERPSTNSVSPPEIQRSPEPRNRNIFASDSIAPSPIQPFPDSSGISPAAPIAPSPIPPSANSPDVAAGDSISPPEIQSAFEPPDLSPLTLHGDLPGELQIDSHEPVAEGNLSERDGTASAPDSAAIAPAPPQPSGNATSDRIREPSPNPTIQPARVTDPPPRTIAPAPPSPAASPLPPVARAEDHPANPAIVQPLANPSPEIPPEIPPIVSEVATPQTFPEPVATHRSPETAPIAADPLPPASVTAQGAAEQTDAAIVQPVIHSPTLSQPTSSEFPDSQTPSSPDVPPVAVDPLPPPAVTTQGATEQTGAAIVQPATHSPTPTQPAISEFPDSPRAGEPGEPAIAQTAPETPPSAHSETSETSEFSSPAGSDAAENSVGEWDPGESAIAQLAVEPATIQPATLESEPASNFGETQSGAMAPTEPAIIQPFTESFTGTDPRQSTQSDSGRELEIGRSTTDVPAPAAEPARPEIQAKPEFSTSDSSQTLTDLPAPSAPGRPVELPDSPSIGNWADPVEVTSHQAEQANEPIQRQPGESGSPSVLPSDIPSEVPASPLPEPLSESSTPIGERGSIAPVPDISADQAISPAMARADSEFPSADSIQSPVDPTIARANTAELSIQRLADAPGSSPESIQPLTVEPSIQRLADAPGLFPDPIQRLAEEPSISKEHESLPGTESSAPPVSIGGEPQPNVAERERSAITAQREGLVTEPAIAPPESQASQRSAPGDFVSENPSIQREAIFPESPIVPPQFSEAIEDSTAETPSVQQNQRTGESPIALPEFPSPVEGTAQRDSPAEMPAVQRKAIADSEIAAPEFSEGLAQTDGAIDPQSVQRQISPEESPIAPIESQPLPERISQRDAITKIQPKSQTPTSEPAVSQERPTAETPLAEASGGTGEERETIAPPASEHRDESVEEVSPLSLPETSTALEIPTPQRSPVEGSPPAGEVAAPEPSPAGESGDRPAPDRTTPPIADSPQSPAEISSVDGNAVSVPDSRFDHPYQFPGETIAETAQPSTIQARLEQPGLNQPQLEPSEPDQSADEGAKSSPLMPAIDDIAQPPIQSLIQPDPSLAGDSTAPGQETPSSQIQRQEVPDSGMDHFAVPGSEALGEPGDRAPRLDHPDRTAQPGAIEQSPIQRATELPELPTVLQRLSVWEPLVQTEPLGATHSLSQPDVPAPSFNPPEIQTQASDRAPDMVAANQRDAPDGLPANQWNDQAVTPDRTPPPTEWSSIAELFQSSREYSRDDPEEADGTRGYPDLNPYSTPAPAPVEVIQRNPVPVSPPVSDPVTSPDPENSQPPPQSQPQASPEQLERLAQEIYRLVKQRLAIEGERSGHHFRRL